MWELVFVPRTMPPTEKQTAEKITLNENKKPKVAQNHEEKKSRDLFDTVVRGGI